MLKMNENNITVKFNIDISYFLWSNSYLMSIYDGKNLRSMIFEWNMFKKFMGIDSMLSVEKL